MKFNAEATPRKQTVVHTNLEEFDLYFEELPISTSNYSRLRHLFKRQTSKSHRQKVLTRKLMAD